MKFIMKIVEGQKKITKWAKLVYLLRCSDFDRSFCIFVNWHWLVWIVFSNWCIFWGELHTDRV